MAEKICAVLETRLLDSSGSGEDGSPCEPLRTVSARMRLLAAQHASNGYGDVKNVWDMPRGAVDGRVSSVSGGSLMELSQGGRSGTHVSSNSNGLVVGPSLTESVKSTGPRPAETAAATTAGAMDLMMLAKVLDRVEASLSKHEAVPVTPPPQRARTTSVLPLSQEQARGRTAVPLSQEEARGPVQRASGSAGTDTTFVQLGTASDPVTQDDPTMDLKAVLRSLDQMEAALTVPGNEEGSLSFLQVSVDGTTFPAPALAATSVHSPGVGSDTMASGNGSSRSSGSRRGWSSPALVQQREVAQKQPFPRLAGAFNDEFEGDEQLGESPTPTSDSSKIRGKTEPRTTNRGPSSIAEKGGSIGESDFVSVEEASSKRARRTVSRKPRWVGRKVWLAGQKAHRRRAGRNRTTGTRRRVPPADVNGGSSEVSDVLPLADPQEAVQPVAQKSTEGGGSAASPTGGAREKEAKEGRPSPTETSDEAREGDEDEAQARQQALEDVRTRQPGARWFEEQQTASQKPTASEPVANAGAAATPSPPTSPKGAPRPTNSVDRPTVKGTAATVNNAVAKAVLPQNPPSVASQRRSPPQAAGSSAQPATVRAPQPASWPQQPSGAQGGAAPPATNDPSRGYYYYQGNWYPMPTAVGIQYASPTGGSQVGTSRTGSYPQSSAPLVYPATVQQRIVPNAVQPYYARQYGVQPTTQGGVYSANAIPALQRGPDPRQSLQQQMAPPTTNWEVPVQRQTQPASAAEPSRVGSRTDLRRENVGERLQSSSRGVVPTARLSKKALPLQLLQTLTNVGRRALERVAEEYRNLPRRLKLDLLQSDVEFHRLQQQQGSSALQQELRDMLRVRFRELAAHQRVLSASTASSQNNASALLPTSAALSGSAPPPLNGHHLLQ